MNLTSPPSVAAVPCDGAVVGHIVQPPAGVCEAAIAVVRCRRISGELCDGAGEAGGDSSNSTSSLSPRSAAAGSTDGGVPSSPDLKFRHHRRPQFRDPLPLGFVDLKVRQHRRPQFEDRHPRQP
ncbi:unnamed protein product [Urochloa humidicola]